MTSSCPDCGAEIAYQAETLSLRTGSCSRCGRTSRLLDGLTLAGVPAVSATPGPDSPPCARCGSPTSLRLVSPDRITATCTSCGATLAFELAGPRAPRERDRGPAGGPSFSAPGRPSSRPCRACGGPLRFSTDEDGLVTGECESCGNRFTLPRRDREAPGRRRFGFSPQPFDRRGGPRRDWKGPRASPGWGRSKRPSGPPRFRPRGPPRADDDDEAEAPRRRRRRE